MINQLIDTAEKKWLSPLETTCAETFSTVFVPSHDHTHHLRVWTYARKILQALELKGAIFTQQQIETLLIAIMFHDQGLSITLDEKHGLAGSEICKMWLETQKKNISHLSVNEILSLIETHEDKNYHTQEQYPYALNTLLGVADDADAFGAIGIYRYAEIYLMRNTPYNEMADRILLNASKRFNHIEKLYKHLEPWFSETQMNFHILEVFYQDLQSCLKYNNSRKTWVLEVINLIAHKIIEKHATPLEIAKYYKQHHPERFVKEYFKLLYKSLSMAK